MKSSRGVKHFFTPALQGEGIAIRGLGVRETIRSWVTRPAGTGDFLLMLFHDPFWISEERGEPLPRGSMMIWPPGAGQIYGSAKRMFSHSWIHCEGPRIKRVVEASRLPLETPFAVADPSSFDQCLFDVHTELVSYAQSDLVIVGNLLENYLRDLARQVGRTTKPSRVPENLLAVRRWIGTAFVERVTLAYLAEMAGMSVPHFCARFKESFGLAPIECLIQHRLHHAAYLLTNRSLNVTEIAGQVGYDDVFHFSKAFKKQFGVSPREARGATRAA